MAVHKVPQDVEAEDHFLGPLTFKQFLFGGGAVICGYVMFLTLDRGLWPVSIVFLLPTLAFAVLAFPWSKDQPTDVWLAARIRFYLVPHKRIWNQDGMKELVTVTAPIRERKIYSDGLSQSEVRNRFGALASMVDSRGWAVKGGVASNTFNAQDDDSDRLADGTITVDPAKSTDTEDPLDTQNSVIARQFDEMIQQSSQATTQVPTMPTSQVEDQVNGQQQAQENFWFLNQQNQQVQQPANPNLGTFSGQAVSTSGSQPVIQAAEDNDVSSNALLEQLHEQQRRDLQQNRVRHERVIDPNGVPPAPPTQPIQQTPPLQAAPQNPISTPPDPAILEPENTNDFTPAASQEAGYEPFDDDGEVVIDLH